MRKSKLNSVLKLQNLARDTDSKDSAVNVTITIGFVSSVSNRC